MSAEPFDQPKLYAERTHADNIQLRATGTGRATAVAESGENSASLFQGNAAKAWAISVLYESIVG